VITSLISGFMAKESVVSIMEVVFKSEEAIRTVLTPVAAASMLVYSLLYTPCVAAIAAIKRELGGRWAFYVVLWQCFIAWIMAFIVRLIGSVF
jgi:ferrous iron transport protein B